jgi:deoxycytidylate deaminase
VSNENGSNDTTSNSDNSNNSSSDESSSPPQKKLVQKTNNNRKSRRLKKNRYTNNKTDLYVVRIRTDGLLGNAKPCAECMNAIRCAGIRRVYYTTDDQTLQRENVKDMVSTHLSHFQLRADHPNLYWHF